MTPEGCVLKAIQDLLAAERIFYGRLNTSAPRRIKGVYVPAPHGFGLGTADILAFPPPYILWIEAKATKNVQSELQKEFQRRVEKIPAHYYLLARSSDDVWDWLRAHRVVLNPVIR